MQASALLLRWGSYRRTRNLRVLIVYLFFLPVMLPSVLPGLSTDSVVRVFPGVWKLLSLKDSLPRTELCPSLFRLFFCLLYFFLPPFEELGCISGCLMSSASIQKLFCGIYSTFKCSFDEFVGEKVFSPSYSSAILAPPPGFCFLISGVFFFLCGCAGSSCCVRAFSSCSKWGPLLLSERKPVIARASLAAKHRP